jgi:hypothetical protein
MQKDIFPKATVIDEAARNWIRDLLVEKGNTNADFYVERPLEYREMDESALVHDLEVAASTIYAPKIYFSGQRGCGKSTALLSLVKDKALMKHYQPIYVSVQGKADLENIDYRDVLFLMARELVIWCKKNYGDLLRGNLKIAAEIIGEEEKTTVSALEKNRVEISEVEISLLSIFKWKLTEPNGRDQIRKHIKENATLLSNLTKEASAFIQANTGRLPLVAYDDLDKPELNLQEEIFFNNFTSLTQQPSCAVIYTFNNALRYDQRFHRMVDSVKYLSNIRLNIDPRSNKPDKIGWQYMRDVVLKRMSKELISDEALDLVVKQSGGVLDQLRDLMYEAIRVASRNSKRVEREHVAEAVDTFRLNKFGTLIVPEVRALLAQVNRNHELHGGELFRNLIYARAVLEHRSKKAPWWDVNPVLIPILPKRKEDKRKILRKLQQGTRK